MATNPDTFNFAPIPPELVGEIEAFDANVEDLLVSRVPDFVGFMWFALSAPDAEDSLEDQPRSGSQTKSELANKVQLRALVYGIGQTVEATGRLLDIIFDTFSGSIDHKQTFSYPGFGTFTVKNRKAREGHNPRTGESITLPATYTVSFKRCARTPTRRPTCH
jgi:nucleoid DNA-binding protein